MPEKLDFRESLLLTRIPFGYELTDIFVKGSVPQLLKDLMVHAYGNLVDILYINYSLEDLFRFGQGDTDERLGLKESLSNGQSVDWSQASPTALLWVLRHFLGLLPTPLLAKRAMGRKFAWWKFSIHCRLTLEHPSDNKNERLVAAIVLEMMRLPGENFDLLCLVMDLFRCLCVYNYGQTERLNKKTVDSLSRYFTASICCRPYRPGNETIIDKQYVPLIKYMIRFWPQIWEICCKLEKDRTPIASAASSAVSVLAPHPHRSGNNATNSDNNASAVTATYADVNTQTSEVDCGGLRSGNVGSNDGIVYLKDAACQTDSCSFDASSENRTPAVGEHTAENCDAVAELKYGGGDKKIKLVKKISGNREATCCLSYGRQSSDDEYAQTADNVDANLRSSLSDLGRIRTSKDNEQDDEGCATSRPADDISEAVTYYVKEPVALNIPLAREHQTKTRSRAQTGAEKSDLNSFTAASSQQSTAAVFICSNASAHSEFDTSSTKRQQTARQECMVVNRAVFEELKQRFQSEKRLHQGYCVKDGGIPNSGSTRNDGYIYDDEFYSCAKSRFARSERGGAASFSSDGCNTTLVDGEAGSASFRSRIESFENKFTNTARDWKYALRFGADYDCVSEDADSSGTTMKVFGENVEKLLSCGKDMNDNVDSGSNCCPSKDASEEIIANTSTRKKGEKKNKELKVSKNVKETTTTTTTTTEEVVDNKSVSSAMKGFDHKSLPARLRDPASASESAEGLAPLRSSASNKSLLSLDKVKARLDFSKIFSSGKKSATLSTSVCTSSLVTSKKRSTSRSFHGFASKIKYKKMKQAYNNAN